MDDLIAVVEPVDGNHVLANEFRATGEERIGSVVRSIGSGVEIRKRQALLLERSL